MRLTIEKPALSKALGHVASVVERRNTIPILSNVLLSAANNELKLTATDLDMELVETVPARAKGEGSTTVPAHMFYDIVRKLPEGNDIELVKDGSSSRVGRRNSRCRRCRPTISPHSASMISVTTSRWPPPTSSVSSRRR